MKAQLEVLMPDPTHSFRSLRVADTRFRHAIHYHPEIELTYIIKSAGTRMVGDHIEPFAAGDLCLIGSNLPHCYHQTSDLKGGAAAEVLQFSRTCGGGILDKSAEWLKVSQLMDRAACGLKFPETTGKRVFPIMTQLRESEGLVRWLHFIEILMLLLDCDQAKPLASPSFKREIDPVHSSRIHKACNFMLERYADPIKHQDIAKHVHMAPASLSRLFRSKTGQTCVDFLTSVRLGNACRLLRESDLTVTEIAFACGFQNLSNFHRRFRQKYQRNPINYRRLIES